MIEETTLRDELARERTLLANERTLLAYGRTTLGLVGLAVIIFKFTDDPIFASVVGTIVLFAAAVTLVMGMRSYRSTNARINGEIAAEEASSLISQLFSIVRN